MVRCIQRVTLQVADLQRSLAFYVNLMGFTVLAQDHSTAKLSVEGYNDPLMILRERPGAIRKPPRTTGLYHVAVLLPSRYELARLFLRLHQSDWPFQGFSDHAVSEAIYLPDPDGNGLELYVDRPRDEWKMENGQVRMTTERLDIQGLLSELDSEDPDAAATLPEGTIIGHVHLHVDHLETAEDFYVGLLGFSVMQRSYPGALFIASDEYHHHLGLNVWAGEGAPHPPEDAVGLKGLSLCVPNAQEPQAVIDRLRRAGVSVAEQANGWVTSDPNGIEIVISPEQA